jgi:hypothetical protein
MTEVPSGFGIQGTLVETTQTTALPSPPLPRFTATISRMAERQLDRLAYETDVAAASRLEQRPAEFRIGDDFHKNN